jgi:hypothetical protein
MVSETIDDGSIVSMQLIQEHYVVYGPNERNHFFLRANHHPQFTLYCRFVQVLIEG